MKKGYRGSVASTKEELEQYILDNELNSTSDIDPFNQGLQQILSNFTTNMLTEA
jgi:hypothetical protein